MLGFWIESGGSNPVHYFGLRIDMAGAGIDVEMAVATLGRACRAVLEELGRWEGNELMVLSKGMEHCWLSEHGPGTHSRLWEVCHVSNCGREGKSVLREWMA